MMVAFGMKKMSFKITKMVFAVGMFFCYKIQHYPVKKILFNILPVLTMPVDGVQGISKLKLFVYQIPC